MAANILLQEGSGSAFAGQAVISERRVGALLCGADLLLLTMGALLVLGLDDRPWSWSGRLLGLIGLLAFPFFKGMFGLYPGHGLSRAQRLRQVFLAVGCAVLVDAGL